jgi:ABC-2 type transport system ATP-binding protein
VLLKAICGFVKITDGEILVENERIIPGKSFIKEAGIIIEQPQMIPYLTGLQNLELLANIEKKISSEEINDALKKVELFEARNKKVKTYSLGMNQRLRIAQAIMENPAILILDEPFNGLDKSGVAKMMEVIKDMKEQGKTILLTSHNQEHIDLLCNKVYQIEGGIIDEI